MNIRRALVAWFAVLLIGISFVSAPGQYHRATVNVPAGVELDDLGADLRRALNAWETAAQSPVSTEWTLVTLSPGETVRLTRDVFVLVVESSGDAPRLLVVGPDGPQDGVVTKGDSTTIGPLEVLLTNHTPSLRRTEVLVRAAGSESSLLSDSVEAGSSSTSIRGQQGQTLRMVVDGPDARAVEFSKKYLNARLQGQSRDGAALIARQAVPPHAGRVIEQGGIVGRSVPYDSPYRDPVNTFMSPEYGEGYYTANVTLHLVRGSSEALQTLSTSGSYDSDGRVPENPRVRVGTTPSGETDVRIGERGDRWQARLRAFESSGSVRVESTTFVRVPLNDRGGAVFNFGGRRDSQSGALVARLAGSDAVELSINSRSGDWSNVGMVNTRVRIRNGSTVALARSATTITRESSSGPPIISGIPYGGPMIGSSSRSSYASDYALFATVTLE